jgi:hypothetical protein
MKRDRCDTWPTCICADKWKLLEQKLPALAPSAEEELEWVTLDVAVMLACVAKRCPDRRARAHAAVQLLHPIFAPYQQH